MLYLSQISIEKIDRSLICRAEQSEREQLVIRRLIGLCHELGMLCVAEGIETGSQIDLLKKLDCDRLQGYKIGKPMPVEEFYRTFSHWQISFLSCVMVEYKLANRGRHFVKVDKWYPLSQICHCCGMLHPEMKVLRMPDKRAC